MRRKIFHAAAFLALVLPMCRQNLLTSAADGEKSTADGNQSKAVLSACACNRGLFPMCSSTSGLYVATSQDCAEQCGGYFYTVQCLFLRYYSWRRKCSCTMDLPDRYGGFCQRETGIVVTRDEDCVKCQKLDETGLEDCEKLADQGITPRLPPAAYEVAARVPKGNSTLPDWSYPQNDPYLLASHIPPGEEYCNRSQDLFPACSMTTGIDLNMTGCEAGLRGNKFTIPCMYLEGMTTESYFEGENPLMAEESAKFVGRVAGYTGCMAVVHKCHEFQRRDGAMIHTTMIDSPACGEEADQAKALWPECEMAIVNGTSKCTDLKAERIFQDAVNELCRPFGAQDFQR